MAQMNGYFLRNSELRTIRKMEVFLKEHKGQWYSTHRLLQGAKIPFSPLHKSKILKLYDVYKTYHPDGNTIEHLSAGTGDYWRMVTF